MHKALVLVPIKTFLEVPIRDIYSRLFIHSNWIIWWIFCILNWHWLPMKTRFPFCFSNDLQYLFYHYFVPLIWQMNSIPIKIPPNSNQMNEKKHVWTYFNSGRYMWYYIAFSYLREVNMWPVIPLLKCRPEINGLDIHLAAQIQTCFGIDSAGFICPL